MMRALAIGLSIATMRLIFPPALIIMGDPTEQQVAFWPVTSFATAFTVHVIAAELVILGTRRAARTSDSTLHHRLRTDVQERISPR